MSYSNRQIMPLEAESIEHITDRVRIIESYPV